MKWRELLLLFAGTLSTARPLRAQRKAMLIIGFRSSNSPGPFAPFLGAFKQGLGEAGYTEGENLAIEYRWAQGHYDRLAGLRGKGYDFIDPSHLLGGQ